MNATAPIPSPAATAMPMRHDGVAPTIGGSDFTSALAAAGRADSDEQLRTAAEQLVSHALLTPMMKMMRDDPFKTELFHGGQAEDMFAAQLDQQLAEDMASQMSLDVVEAVYNRFAGQAEPPPSAPPAALPEVGPRIEPVAPGLEVDRHG